MTNDGIWYNEWIAGCVYYYDYQHFLPYNCFIHRQALYCNIQNLRHDFHDASLYVMGICMKIMNSVQGRRLQRRMFWAQLEENESDYGELLYNADVRWLNRSTFYSDSGTTTVGKSFS
ncbi:hypothetical protein TNCV_3951711 [Trichonephila clavipes]|nr:hypothetical protein TNCV_3951711 [Trichonephila clavipes]